MSMISAAAQDTRGAAIASQAQPSPADSQGELLLDDPHEWTSFGRLSAPADGVSDVWESHVVVEGMHCAACALTIEDALRSVPGVERAEVSAATQRARVVWHSGQVLPSQWLAAVRKSGYRALPAMDAMARDQRVREHRKALWRWLVAGFCMMQVMMYAWPAYVAEPGDLSAEMERLLRWASWVITLPVVFFACGPFFGSALRDIRQRRISMDLPVALGMAITFVVSTAGTFEPDGVFGYEVYYDSLTMFVFFLLTGRWLELRLRDRTAGALEAVMNRLPASVERRMPGGAFERVAVRRLGPGDVVRVLPGEAFPADGCLVEGRTLVDEALLTGESTPVTRGVGQVATAGSYNLQSAVLMQVQGVGADTRFGQIVALMESASLQKPRLAQLADKVARPFLVLVLLAAGLAALWWWPTDPGRALMVAVSVLIVTCPCALSLATPVAMLSAAGTLARNGVLVRNLQGLEALASVDTVVFDKTGTLTRDGMAVRSVLGACRAWGVERENRPQRDQFLPDLQPNSRAIGQKDGKKWAAAADLQPTIRKSDRLLGRTDLGADDALALAAALAQHSLHPVSRALVAAAQDPQRAQPQSWLVEELQEHSGLGLSALVRDAEGRSPARRLLLGSARHIGVHGVHGVQGEEAGQWVFLAWQPEGGAPLELARFELTEDLRPEAPTVVAALRRAGVGVQLLSGDRSPAAARLAAQAGIVEWRGDCTPQNKLDVLQGLQSQGRKVAMVGDGLNDGPVLAGAHVSFAFGRSVPLAQSRSDFVVLGDDLALVAQSIVLARQTLRVVRQNLWWAAGYNALCVPLAVAGYMPAWLAGLGMALSSLLVVLNAARLSTGLQPLAGVGGSGLAGMTAPHPATQGA